MDQTKFHTTDHPILETISPFYEGEWMKFADVIKAEIPWIISCAPCRIAGRGLNRDWSTDDWILPDGTKTRY